MKLLSPLAPLGAFPFPALPPSANRSPFLEHALVDPYPVLTNCFALIGESIVATRDDCVSRGIGYLAYAQPDRAYVLRETIPDGPNGERYDREADVAVLRQVFEKERIDYLPFGEVLRNHPEGIRAFFEFDPHMNETGNRILADALADWLIERKIGPASGGCAQVSASAPLQDEADKAP